MDGQVLGIRGTGKTMSSGWSISSMNLDSGEQEMRKTSVQLDMGMKCGKGGWTMRVEMQK